jgi:hypothetical protein
MWTILVLKRNKKMSICKEFEELVEKRKTLCGEINYESDPIIKEMVSLMTSNVSSTITFLRNNCSPEQFVWISEIADEITACKKSIEFIQELRNLCNKYPDVTAKYNIRYFVESAAEYLE